ncbi:MAG: 5'/3'-nucleotidase SurE [Dehalococcoidia bacterium]|nr:MAG: 5'/3'-nucleotidase SurE [Dehalococcoidia bacterium]
MVKILLTNDDGIGAEGLRTLAETLGKSFEVVVAAPDRERSAIGTAVTLRRSLKVRCDPPLTRDCVTYAISGTPTDCVILALGKMVPDVDLVISGINQGHNLGDDILISGTVAGALQGYLRGKPAIAVSVANPEFFPGAARIAARLAARIADGSLPPEVFLNVNLPDLSLDKIKETRVTNLSSASHIDTVDESIEDGQTAYRLLRRRTANHASPGTDIWAVEHGQISISPLHTLLLGRVQPKLNDQQFADLI